MKNDPNLYKAYKPLRNNIRKTSLEDALYVLWAYSQNMQLKTPIPTDIEVHSRYTSEHFGERGIYPWDVEVLARETLLNAENAGFSIRRHETFKKISFLGKILNQLRGIDNVVTKKYIHNENILIEFSRLLNRQVPWQKLHLSSYITRYYKIFGTEKINPIMQDTCGLSTLEILRIGMLLYFSFVERPAILLPIDYGVPEFSKAKIDMFLSRFATNLPTIKELIEKEQNYNDQFFYSGVALRFYPLIEMQYNSRLCMVCPLPTLFFMRITSGLFYELTSHKYFGEAFGESFENYAGDVFNKVLLNSNLQAIKEATFKVGKDEKKTADWILKDPKAALFIECKTKRMQNGSKTCINDIAVVTSDINILANAIIQCYKTIADYKKGRYPNLEYDASTVIYPLVVTVEEWYIFNPKYQNLLRDMVIAGLAKNNLAENTLREMPYSFCSIDELESMLQVVTKVGIKEFFEPKVRDQEKNGYVFSTYYGERFPIETAAIKYNLFEDEYKAIFETSKS